MVPISWTHQSLLVKTWKSSLFIIFLVGDHMRQKTQRQAPIGSFTGNVSKEHQMIQTPIPSFNRRKVTCFRWFASFDGDLLLKEHAVALLCWLHCMNDFLFRWYISIHPCLFSPLLFQPLPEMGLFGVKYFKSHSMCEVCGHFFYPRQFWPFKCWPLSYLWVFFFFVFFI